MLECLLIFGGIGSLFLNYVKQIFYCCFSSIETSEDNIGGGGGGKGRGGNSAYKHIYC